MAGTFAPIRIAFCITDLDPGGAERALVQLVTRLDRQSWDPAVFCLARPGALVETLQHSGISVTCLGARGRRDLRVVNRLRKALARFRPQIVQTFLFDANLAGRIAGRLAGIPHCVSGIRVAEKRSRWPLWLDRVTQRLVDVNVCVSQAVADFSVQFARLPREKLIVIPNGVDVEAFSQATPFDWKQLGLPPSSRILLAVGRLDPQKGLAFLIEAFAQIAKGCPDVHLVLVGSGPERARLEELAARNELAARIHFAGWQANVASYLRGAECLVLSSLWEGMPNVVLEAMAAGIPVVATQVEGVDELVVSETTGLVVPPRSSAALANALETLLGDRKRAQAMGRAGQERANAAFSWEMMARRYETLYRGLVEN